MKTVREIQREIESLRSDEQREKDKPVRVSQYITVDYTALDKLPGIRLKYVVGGGPFMTFDYEIIGGPDHGKRITLVPWRARWACKDIAENYNGTPDEAEAAYGYASRPAIQYNGTLHVGTIMFIRGDLRADREYGMAREMNSLYEARDKASQAEAVPV